jgi:hypothetical protein
MKCVVAQTFITVAFAGDPTFGETGASGKNPLQRLQHEAQKLSTQLTKTHNADQKQCANNINMLQNQIGQSTANKNNNQDEMEKALASFAAFSAAATKHAQAAAAAEHRADDAMANTKAMKAAHKIFDRYANEFIATRHQALIDGNAAQTSICNQAKSAGAAGAESGSNNAMGALCTLVTDVVASIQEAHDNKVVSLKTHKNAHDNGISTQSGYEETATDAKKTEAAASKSNAADAAAKKKSAQQLEISIVRLTKQLADYKDQLAEEKQTCEKKANDYQVAVSAVKQFIKLIQTPEVQAAFQYSYNKMTSALIQKSATSFLQQRSSSTSLKSQIINMLKNRSGDIQSEALLEVAERIQESPFTKVIDLINKMVSKLKNTIGESEDHYTKCLTSLAENEKQRNAATEVVLAQRQKNAAASSAATSANGAWRQAEKDIASAEGFRSDMIRARSDAAATWATDKGNLEGAIAAVQLGYDAMMETTLDDDSNRFGPVKSLCQNMLTDLQSDLDDGIAEEKEAKATHKQALLDFEASIRNSQKSVESNKMTELTEKNKMSRSNKKWKYAVDELRDYIAMYNGNANTKGLKDTCLSGGTTFEQRAQKRKDEIESLQQALDILNGPRSGQTDAEAAKENI